MQQSVKTEGSSNQKEKRLVSYKGPKTIYFPWKCFGK